MKTQLLIWLGLEGAPIRWLLSAEKGQSILEEGQLLSISELSALAELSKQSTTYMLVPGEYCLHRVVEPPRRGKFAQQAIPFMIEDKLCTPLESVHIVYCRKKSSKVYDVVVVDHNMHAEWLKCIANAGLDVNYLLPDYFALSIHNAYVLQDGQRFICHHPDHSTSVNSDLLPLWCEQWVDESEQKATIDLIVDSSYTDKFSLSLANTAIRKPLQPAGVLHFIAANLTSSIPTNLMSEAVGPRNNVLRWVSIFRIPVIACCVLFLLSVANKAIENYQLTRQIASSDAKILREFKAAMPDTRRIVNPVGQMRAKLATHATEEGDKSTFIGLLSQAVQPLESLEGVRLTTMRFDRAESSLKFDLQAQDFAALEGISRLLEQQALNVSVGSFQRVNDDIARARYTVTGK